MFELNKQQVFDVIVKVLKKTYHEFEGEPRIELSLSPNRADYNFITRQLHFKQHIVVFQFEGDIQRRLTIKEIKKILRNEYSCAEVKLDVYIDFPDDDSVFEQLKDHAIFRTIIDYGKTFLKPEDYMEMIDMALVMGDRKWFEELSKEYSKCIGAK
jgi:hypothetical protein